MPQTASTRVVKGNKIIHLFWGCCGEARLRKRKLLPLIDLFVREAEKHNLLYRGDLTEPSSLSAPFLTCFPNPCRVSSAWRWCWRRHGSGCWSRSCWSPPQSWKERKRKNAALDDYYWHIIRSIPHLFQPLNASCCPKSIQCRSVTWLCFQSPSGPGCRCMKWRRAWTDPRRRVPSAGALWRAGFLCSWDSAGHAHAHSRSPCNSPAGGKEQRFKECPQVTLK